MDEVSSIGKLMIFDDCLFFCKGLFLDFGFGLRLVCSGGFCRGRGYFWKEIKLFVFGFSYVVLV